MTCPTCPESRAALALLEDELDVRDVIAIEFHADAPLANSATVARRAYYSDPLPPTLFFDGGSEVVDPVDPVAAFRSRIVSGLAAPTPLAMEALYVWDPDTGRGEITIDLEVTTGESIPFPGEWTVRAFVVEDAVTACCGTGGQDRWDRIVRLAVPDEPLAIATGDEHRQVVHTFPLDPGWNLDRLGAIAFVQRDASGEVLNAYRALDALSLQPVPAAPIDPSRARLLPIVPNPLRTKSRISFTMPAEDQARVTIHDGRGRLVRVLTDGTRPDGLHPLFWDATDGWGKPMASGMYFVRLATSRGVDTAKLIVLH